MMEMVLGQVGRNRKEARKTLEDVNSNRNSGNDSCGNGKWCLWTSRLCGKIVSENCKKREQGTEELKWTWGQVFWRSSPSKREEWQSWQEFYKSQVVFSAGFSGEGWRQGSSANGWATAEPVPLQMVMGEERSSLERRLAPMPAPPQMGSLEFMLAKSWGKYVPGQWEKQPVLRHMGIYKPGVVILFAMGTSSSCPHRRPLQAQCPSTTVGVCGAVQLPGWAGGPVNPTITLNQAPPPVEELGLTLFGFLSFSVHSL